jgi:GNAT superfamily N-acetyltransferase
MRMPVETSTEIALRQARDNDSADLIELIGGCYAEYPGCYLDVQEEEPWLLEPATAYGRWRGRLWVAERDGKVVASGGLRPSGPGMAGVHHLYVASSERRQGLATRLLELIEAEARARGAHWTHLWSDTRFVQAHRLYERLGYVRSGGFRERQDLSQSMEYHFVKLLPTGSGQRRF